MENLKNLLIQKINACDEEKVLHKLLGVFSETDSAVQEPETNYKKSEKSLIPDWHLEELREDMEKLKRGELKTYTYDEFKDNMKKKLDELRANS